MFESLRQVHWEERGGDHHHGAALVKVCVLSDGSEVVAKCYGRDRRVVVCSLEGEVVSEIKSQLPVVRDIFLACDARVILTIEEQSDSVEQYFVSYVNGLLQTVIPLASQTAALSYAPFSYPGPTTCNNSNLANIALTLTPQCLSVWAVDETGVEHLLDMSLRWLPHPAISVQYARTHILIVTDLEVCVVSLEATLDEVDNSETGVMDDPLCIEIATRHLSGPITFAHIPTRKASDDGSDEDQGAPAASSSHPQTDDDASHLQRIHLDVNWNQFASFSVKLGVCVGLGLGLHGSTSDLDAFLVDAAIEIHPFSSISETTDADTTGAGLETYLPTRSYQHLKFEAYLRCVHVSSSGSVVGARITADHGAHLFTVVVVSVSQIEVFSLDTGPEGKMRSLSRTTLGCRPLTLEMSLTHTCTNMRRSVASSLLYICMPNSLQVWMLPSSAAPDNVFEDLMRATSSGHGTTSSSGASDGHVACLLRTLSIRETCTHPPLKLEVQGIQITERMMKSTQTCPVLVHSYIWGHTSPPVSLYVTPRHVWVLFQIRTQAHQLRSRPYSIDGVVNECAQVSPLTPDPDAVCLNFAPVTDFIERAFRNAEAAVKDSEHPDVYQSILVLRALLWATAEEYSSQLPSLYAAKSAREERLARASLNRIAALTSVCVAGLQEALRVLSTHVPTNVSTCTLNVPLWLPAAIESFTWASFYSSRADPRTNPDQCLEGSFIQAVTCANDWLSFAAQWTHSRTSKHAQTNVHRDQWNEFKTLLPCAWVSVWRGALRMGLQSHAPLSANTPAAPISSLADALEAAVTLAAVSCSVCVGIDADAAEVLPATVSLLVLSARFDWKGGGLSSSRGAKLALAIVMRWNPIDDRGCWIKALAMLILTSSPSQDSLVQTTITNSCNPEHIPPDCTPSRFSFLLSELPKVPIVPESRALGLGLSGLDSLSDIHIPSPSRTADGHVTQLLLEVFLTHARVLDTLVPRLQRLLSSDRSVARGLGFEVQLACVSSSHVTVSNMLLTVPLSRLVHSYTPWLGLGATWQTDTIAVVDPSDVSTLYLSSCWSKLQLVTSPNSAIAEVLEGFVKAVETATQSVMGDGAFELQECLPKLDYVHTCLVLLGNAPAWTHGVESANTLRQQVSVLVLKYIELVLCVANIDTHTHAAAAETSLSSLEVMDHKSLHLQTSSTCLVYMKLFLKQVAYRYRCRPGWDMFRHILVHIHLRAPIHTILPSDSHTSPLTLLSQAVVVIDTLAHMCDSRIVEKACRIVADARARVKVRVSLTTPRTDSSTDPDASANANTDTEAHTFSTALTFLAFVETSLCRAHDNICMFREHAREILSLTLNAPSQEEQPDAHPDMAALHLYLTARVICDAKTHSHSQERWKEVLRTLACFFAENQSETHTYPHSHATKGKTRTVALRAFQMCVSHLAEKTLLDAIVDILPDDVDCSYVIDCVIRACNQP